MEIGVIGLCTDETIRPDDLAVLVEQAGFDALVLGEHTHIPASRETPAPHGELPRAYARTYDLFVALTAAALATTRIGLGSGIIQLAQRDPIICAKEAASLDVLSGGRLDLIVGHGWNVEEMRHHGVRFEDRYDIVREKMLAMREIFREDEASFHGDHVSFDRIWSWPKPVQPGGVPLYYGGNSPGSEERARTYGDGWGPIAGPGMSERIRAFKDDGPDLPVAVTIMPPDPETLNEYAEAGADRAIVGPVDATDGDAAKRSLEELRSIADAVAA